MIREFHFGPSSWREVRLREGELPKEEVDVGRCKDFLQRSGAVHAGAHWHDDLLIRKQKRRENLEGRDDVEAAEGQDTSLRVCVLPDEVIGDLRVKLNVWSSVPDET